MKGKMNAIAMTLLMIASALAGCTSDDPDGDDNSGIDMEILNQMIDDNLQDFINNTSVTVNNYHSSNETHHTYNSYNGSGAGSESIMQMFTVNWAHSDVEVIDYGSRIVTLNDTLQQTTGNPYLLYALIYEGNLIEFENVTCEQFRNFASMERGNWQNYLEGTYGGYGSDEAEELEDFWLANRYGSSYSDVALNSDNQSVREQCPGIYSSSYEDHYTTLFEIELSIGEALGFMSIPNIYDIVLECDDGYISSLRNNSAGMYLGGQADCIVSGIAQIRSTHSYNRLYWDNEQFNGDNSTNNSNNGSSNSNNADVMLNDTYSIPDWWYLWSPSSGEWNAWYFYGGSDGHTYSETPTEFAVYFTTYFVEVYDVDSE